jgi:hypothetical protein
MNNVTARTSIDIPIELMKKVKIQAAERGEPLKTVITEALTRYVVSKPSPSGEELWADMRHLSKYGRQDVDLIEFLRKDRRSH